MYSVQITERGADTIKIRRARTHYALCIMNYAFIKAQNKQITERGADTIKIRRASSNYAL